MRRKEDYLRGKKEELEAMVEKMKAMSKVRKSPPQNAPVQDYKVLCVRK